MKNTIIRQLLKAGMVAMALVVIAVALPSPAAAANPNITNNARDCLVDDPSWNMYASGDFHLTLRKALEYARRSEACMGSITLATDVVAQGPMEINTTELLDGAGHTVDFETWNGGADECAMTINTDGVVVQNLKMENIDGDNASSPSSEAEDILPGLFEATVGPHGICMTEMDAHIINVDIDGVDGDAFVFGEGTSGNTVYATSSAAGVRGYGVRDASAAD